MTAAKSRIKYARNAKERIRNRANLAAMGVPSRVPTGPVQAHVLELLGMGLSLNAIALAAGVADTTVSFIRDGQFIETRTVIAAAIMSVDHRPHPRQRFVPTVGAVRRLGALQAMGWKYEDLDRECGTPRGTLQFTRKRGALTYERWAQIRDMYERLSATPGGSEMATHLARRHDYLLPLEWEGYDIDDPRVSPPRSARSTSRPVRKPGGRKVQPALDEVLIQRAVDGNWDGPIPFRERRAAFKKLHARGYSAAQIADRLKVSKRTVERLRAAA
ncbi:helix-turn-helix domain-containing protein [Rhodococcus erythropolis]|uniref:helix-turn-helix domain-containing protein n=1 Tax=Rhodococcus erythropolis TaxID=1833 RepID=UPI0024BA0FB5|nr:helix-turn-helix domain-containing protein [Rhodococcus erythropolis]MDJ0405850.1 helix-turn-helix domain-containing protein [Rhodococcus erythropolis]